MNTASFIDSSLYAEFPMFDRTRIQPLTDPPLEAVSCEIVKRTSGNRAGRSFMFCLLLGHFAACSSGEPPLPGGAIRLGTVDGRNLQEISGMAASRRNPGVLWAHNDGSDGRFFAFATNGQLVAALKPSIKVDDWEDVAIGPGPAAGVPYIYIADIGDNNEERRSIRISRLPEPDLRLGSAQDRSAGLGGIETFKLRYPDGRHNAEALLVDPLSGDVIIVTKAKKKARVYVVRQEQLDEKANVTLTFARAISVANVSAGDVSPDGLRIILRRENAALLWVRAPEETVAAALARAPRFLPVIGPPREPNGESIAWSANGNGYYTVSEGRAQPIYFFPVLSD